MKKTEEHSERIGKDRWLVSYADFITLLFAFFVVMYSVSSINNEKYHTLSEALNKAFPESVNNFGVLNKEKLDDVTTLLTVNKNKLAANWLPNTGELLHNKTGFQNGDLVLKLTDKFKELILDGKVLVKDSADWLEIQVGSNVLFNTASSFLNNDAEAMIKELADILVSTSNMISIEGFTDNVPIHNTVFPSNWELSADRAATVARAFIAAGIKSDRLAVIGYGENFPIADNKTAEGRQQNRRIVIVIEKENKRKDYLTKQAR